ncbi:MAG: putative toxin-antitoxin system antitoxin component (TIGR02293 family) [Luteibaculaceae bacterium]|jgi:putative toxin-antitoxin system antitoxin component (TIGR02293 family)
MSNPLNISPFNTKGSVDKARVGKTEIPKWTLFADGKSFAWSNRMERVQVIRAGIPYDSIEIISKKMNSPVKLFLNLVGLAQTTYNKKKVSHSLLDSRDSELILRISELIDFGLDVFNSEEEKFQNWMIKPNLALNGIPPIKFLDTISGINEVKFCLNRIEHGNFA